LNRRLWDFYQLCLLTCGGLSFCCLHCLHPIFSPSPLQGGEKGGNARKEQMGEEHGGDASAGYAEMGQKGGQA
jgi:hypothetical protein